MYLHADRVHLDFRGFLLGEHHAEDGGVHIIRVQDAYSRARKCLGQPPETQPVPNVTDDGGGAVASTHIGEREIDFLADYNRRINRCVGCQLYPNGLRVACTCLGERPELGDGRGERDVEPEI